MKSVQASGTCEFSKMTLLVKEGVLLIDSICHSGDSNSGELAIPLLKILIGVSTGEDTNLLFKGCTHSFH